MLTDEYLLKAIAEGDLNTSFRYAVTEEEIEKFLSLGADIESKDQYGYTRLITASCHGKLNIVKLLVQAGADINAKTSADNTSLHMATIRGHLEIVEFLLAAGADINAKNKDRDKALHFAKHLDIARALVMHGSDPDAIGSYGRTLLQTIYHMRYNNADDIIRFLIDECGVRTT